MNQFETEGPTLNDLVTAFAVIIVATLIVWQWVC